MKICVIGKISPIQGGVSKLNSWICQALAEAGHEVHLVTNGSEVEPQYRTIGGTLNADLAGSPLAGLAKNLVVHYTDEQSHYAYIPYANPFVSKLTSIAIDVIRQHGCDLIFGHYFEPYGVAAYFASIATATPFGLMHAGSDVGRLLQSRELRTLYGEMMRRASYVFASNSTRRRFIQEGVDPDKLHSLPRSTCADKLYTPDCVPLDLAAHVAKARIELKGSWYESLLDAYPLTNYRPERPTVAIYGKTGAAKGSYDLLAALAALRGDGMDFNLLALTSSGQKSLSTFLSKASAAGLADHVTWLPFVPHWKIPEFLKRADVVCFLERDFSIPIHHPAIPVEVMLCGACLVMSSEIAEKQRYKAALEDGQNVLIVDPKDIAALAEKLRPVLRDPALAHRIGLAGRDIMRMHVATAQTLSVELGRTFDAIYSTILTRKEELSMIEFQSFLARLYTDDVFRKLNDIDPSAAQAFFTLTEEEKALLRKVEARAVEHFADSLKAKHRERHLKIFPLTVAVLKGKAKTYFERFYSLNRPYPGETKTALASKFGQFLEDTILSDDDNGCELGELVRFERRFVDLALRTGPADDFSLINERSAPVTVLDDDTLLFLKDSVYLEHFDFDIPAYVEQVKTAPETAQARRAPTTVVFIVAANEANPKVLKINEATATLLTLARQRISVKDLADAFANALRRPVPRSDVLEATTFFVRNGLLAVMPAALVA